MEKYIPSGLKRKDGTDIMCLSYKYFLAHPEEFRYKKKKMPIAEISEITGLTIEEIERLK